MQCNYIMSLNMHHNNINTEYVKASAEALFNGTIARGGGSHAGELILEWRNLKCWLRDWHISKTAGPPALTVTHCAKQQWHTWRPGLVGPDTAQEQQTRACAHIWISHICTARGHNQLTATSVASLSKQLADIKESIPPKDDAIPGQARQKASSVINRKYLSGCHKIRAHRCTDRLIVDKSRKNATTPISSLCRIPRMASLPSAPWSGRDLASASQTAHTDTKRSKREMQLAGILAATSLVPDRRPCVHISDFFPPSDVFEWSRDAADCVGFALFLLSEEERRKESYVSLCWSPVEQRPICTTLIPIWTLHGPWIGRSKSLLK